MKINLVKKFKWYIIGFILVAIMLSVSLSFCSWDNMSLQAGLDNNGSGEFTNRSPKYSLIEDRYLPNGSLGSNNIADVGDIVSFGNYYQDANTTTKTPIRWIVVEKENKQLTLLAEKVMAFGNFWGNYYFDVNGIAKWGPRTNGVFYQNYSESTLRAWLNSYFSGNDARNDAGTPFKYKSSEPRFSGFLSEAFTATEQSFILPKSISGMKGYGKDCGKETQLVDYATINDKVWVPSGAELYGANTTVGDVPLDGSPSKRFSYFNNAVYGNLENNLIGKTTAFASSSYSNFTDEAATHTKNAQNSLAGSIVWWWLRTPSNGLTYYTQVVYTTGTLTHADSYCSFGGVRPAIIISA